MFKLDSRSVVANVATIPALRFSQFVCNNPILVEMREIRVIRVEGPGEGSKGVSNVDVCSL